MATHDPIELEALNTGYRVGHNCLEPWERDILARGEELLSAFAHEATILDWAERHNLLGADYHAAYRAAVRAQKPARRPGARTGIR